MIPLSPPLLIAAAAGFVGAGAESRTCRGRLVDLLCARTGRSDESGWSAAFVHHAGHWSHYDFRTRLSAWPLPATSDPRELDAFARERSICADDPAPGDVFLHWSPVRRVHVRAGIIASVEGQNSYPLKDRGFWVCTTIEGETDEYARPNGTEVHIVRRNLSVPAGDRFLRWTALDGRQHAADESVERALVMGWDDLRRAA